MKKLLVLAIVVSLSPGIATLLDAQDSDAFERTFNPFLWVQVGGHAEAGDDGDSSLMLSKARFGARGRVSPELSYHLMFAGALMQPGSSGEDRQLKLLQTWIGYDVTESTNLRFGQFKYPFGIGTYPAFTKWEFNRPAFINTGIARELVRGDQGADSGYFRDLGVQLSSGIDTGSGYKLDYKMMVMNGNGILRNDDNSQQDFVGRAALSSPKSKDSGSWTLGASLYSGALHHAGETPPEDHDEEAWGVDFRWDLHENGLRVASLQAEMIEGKTEAGGHDILPDGEVTPNGFYIQGVYFTSPDFYWGARFEEFDHDKNTEGEDTRERTTIGACYYLDGQKNLHRVNVNYEIFDDPDHSSEDQININVTLVF